MPVSFSDLQLAFEFVSSGGMGENEAYLDRQSGKIYWHSGFGDNDEGRRTGSATETCGPEATPRPKPPCCGYGVDTLRSADNVRGTPGEFQRGADPQGKRAASGWGDIPGAAPRKAWHWGPNPVNPTRRGSIRCHSPG
jgi:hypothetical protein